MSLDLHETAAQLDAVTLRLRDGAEWRAEGLGRIVETLRSTSASLLNGRAAQAQGRMVFPHADCLEEPGLRHAPPDTPTDFCALSVDGSHIDVSRHLPVRCYLLNVGGCKLVYGSAPTARLFHRAHLAVDDELYVTDPEAPLNAQVVEGALLGIKRSAEELAALASWAKQLPHGLPALALVDGSLVLWQLSGQGPPPGRYPDYVRRTLLEEGFLGAMGELADVSTGQPLALAGYISLPGSAEVVNTLRLALCPYVVADCNDECAKVPASHRPCEPPGSLTDRDLFAALLAPGERSALFGSRAAVVRDHYGRHAIRFFYVNVGAEIARVEVPAWVAEDELLLGLTHALVLDQCRRGQGYPVAVQEAHEQAVITGGERREFQRMLERALEGRRLPVFTSEKERSKLHRGV